MEKQVKERGQQATVTVVQPNATQKPAQARQSWEEQEILALQERARHHQRRYPAGGYQGL